jgi:hypothetical protein
MGVPGPQPEHAPNPRLKVAGALQQPGEAREAHAKPPPGVECPASRLSGTAPSQASRLKGAIEQLDHMHHFRLDPCSVHSRPQL